MRELIDFSWVNVKYQDPLSKEESMNIMKRHLELMLLKYKKEEHGVANYINTEKFQKDWSDFCRLHDLQTINGGICSVTNIEAAIILAMGNEEGSLNEETLQFVKVMKRSISKTLEGLGISGETFSTNEELKCLKNTMNELQKNLNDLVNLFEKTKKFFIIIAILGKNNRIFRYEK